MKIILRIMLLFALGCSSVWAQNTTTTGKVTSENGESIPGVSILLKGTATGTISDANGNFSINASEGILQFSFIGYKPVEITIDKQASINVVMVEDLTTLDQVVVIGYGTQQKKDITGAVSVIDEKAFDSRPNTQFGNLIQGKTAGVQVITPSGKPSIQVKSYS